jgi:formylglycine-generating enzyme required for sulfatase activity
VSGARLAVGAVLLAVSAACAQHGTTLPPAGQLLVYLDTDAIVPDGTAHPYGPLQAYPLFDHVRFDAVSADGSPCDCSRDFEVDADKISKGQISFAILPGSAPAAGMATLRARLFRYGDTVGGEPRSETAIDSTFSIEPIPAEGVLERTLFLKTQDVGVPQGKTAPLPMSPGRPAVFHAGTWPLAARVDCPGPPRPGEVCIPGGAFWMGSPLEARNSNGSGSQRLVVLSPYYLGANEVTVADFRKSGLPGVTPWSGEFKESLVDYCRYTAAPGQFDDLPVNCVGISAARAYCARLGADLPTEAQYEYAAGALQSAPYVWGSDPPTCDAVVMCQDSLLDSDISGDPTCKQPGAPGGPLKIGSGALDRLDLPTGTVLDLIGNVSEYARDAWNRLVEPCWSRPGLYADPVCTTPGRLDPLANFTMRGGEWEKAPNRASGRFFGNVASPTTGFRCARDAK